MKDNFSAGADAYRQFRPHYPDAFYAYLKDLLPQGGRAWDCGTGNGQVAFRLSEQFDEVYATDISQAQLEQAPRKENIIYRLAPAEHTAFPDAFFDLVVVAQAVHWFQFDAFYTEVRRVAKAGAYIVLIGYGLLSVDEQVDKLIAYLYRDVLGTYWDPERHYIDDLYRTIPFPFAELAAPDIHYCLDWNLDMLLGYLSTWSALRHYQKDRATDPLPAFAEKLSQVWSAKESKPVCFPFLIRIGRVHQ